MIIDKYLICNSPLSFSFLGVLDGLFLVGFTVSVF